MIYTPYKMTEKEINDLINSCELGRCPLYKGDCIDKCRCLAKEHNLLDTAWNILKYPPRPASFSCRDS